MLCTVASKNTVIVPQNTRRTFPPETLRVLQFNAGGYSGPNKVGFWANFIPIPGPRLVNAKAPGTAVVFTMRKSWKPGCQLGAY